VQTVGSLVVKLRRAMEKARNMRIVSKKKMAAETSKEKMLKAFLPPGILTLLTVLFYAPSMYYPFQFDDIANISKRFGIRFDAPWMRWWGSSRWLGEWLNIINFNMGGFDPFYYRIINLGIHISAGIILFYLVLNICEFLKESTFLHENALYIAFSSAVLFLLHPVQTQTVSYVIQARMEGLATFFILATIFTFIKAIQAKTQGTKILMWTLFAVSGFLANGTKEIVVVTPFLLLLVDWFFISDQQWEKFKKRIWIHAIFDVAFFAFLINHIGTKTAFDAVSMKMVTGNNRGNILTNRAFDVITPWQYFKTEFKVILHYLTMFIWPVNISVEYDWKLASDFMSAAVLAPFTVLFPLGLYVLYSAINKKNTVFTFGLLWFFISVAPRSTFVPSPELVCDYKTYLASIGIMFILSTILVWIVQQVFVLFKEIPNQLYLKEIKIGLLAILSIPIGFAAMQRNSIWQTTVSFWEDNAKNAPGKARVWNNLGVARSEHGKIDDAIDAYKKAVALDKFYADPLSNIAVAYSLKGDVDKAIDALRGAIHINPSYAEAYNNLGTLLIQKERYQEAEEALDVALQIRPYYGKANYNKARLYEARDDHEKSYEYLKRATQGDLDTPEVFFKLGQMSLRLKKYAEAERVFEHVIKLGYDNEQVHFNLANATFMNGNHQRAENIYIELAKNNPLDGRYTYNLAETLFTQKKYQSAFELFRKATNLPKPLPQAFFRAAHCLEKLHKVDEAIAFLKDLETVTAPDEFKKTLKAEITRIDLQSKVNTGNGSIGFSDLKTALAPHTVGDKKEIKKG